MPDLDVSDLLLDPDVAQELIIERRKITMGVLSAAKKGAP